MATPLLLVLILVEFTDLIFAVDSIPAIFGVTTDPFIVFTSNIFAILGLRSLYFLLAAVVDRFYLLKYGLAVILTFVGVKMLGESFFQISIVLSLAIILGVLATVDRGVDDLAEEARQASANVGGKSSRRRADACSAPHAQRFSIASRTSSRISKYSCSRR